MNLDFEEVAKITERPQSTWTNKEKDSVYWWYFHEMEEPTEEQLRYCAQNYGIYKNLAKWCAFLLSRFPSEENIDFVQSVVDGDFGVVRRKYSFHKIMKIVLQTRPLSMDHIELVIEYGTRSTRMKAMRIASRLYEI